MYTNFIYFIIVLFIFSSQQPAVAPRFSALASLAATLGLLWLFALINHLVFRRLTASVSALGASSRLAVLYQRAVSRQSFLALVFFCLEVYLLDIKLHLIAVSLVRASFTLQGLAAIGLFLLHLSIVWLYSNDCYSRISGVSRPRISLVVSNLKLNLAIILPWLFIAGTFDLLQLLPLGALHEGLNEPLGQLFFFACLLVVFMLFAPPVVVRLWGCRPVPAGSRRAVMEKFCREQNFQVKEILLWPAFGSAFPTAGVMGLHRGCRYLLVTEGLLAILDDDELSAVLAHEMGHVKERHLLFYLFFLMGYLILAYPLSGLSFLLVLASDLPLKMANSPDSQFLNLLSVLSTLPLLLLLILYFRFLFGFFIRNFERQADLHVFTAMGRPFPLISALEKVAFHSGDSRDVPSWHHFSVKQRVDYLEAVEKRPSLLRGHRLKIRRALVGYLIGVGVLGATGYFFDTGALGESLNEHLEIHVLARLVHTDPENAQLRLLLGTLYYAKGKVEEAVLQLESALELAPNSPEIMNNLAWIYATSDSSLFFKPPRALELAQEAAGASQESHILDTLAEAYHVNGQTKQALATAEQALAAASGNSSYYRSQVEKFRSMVEARESEM